MFTTIFAGLKLFTLAVLCIFSGGVIFMDYFKGNKLIMLLLMLFTSTGSFYLAKDVCSDFEDSNICTYFYGFEISEYLGTAGEVIVLPPIKDGFDAIFKPTKNMFETTQQFLKREQQLLVKFTQMGKTRNLDYRVGEAYLETYDADKRLFSLKLDWQAEWLKTFFKQDFPETAMIKVPIKAAKKMYESSQNKPLFIGVALGNDDKLNVWGILSEFNQNWEFSLSDSSPISSYLSSGEEFQDRLKDGGLGPKMVVIPAGSFQMGDIQGGGYDNEKPVHRVNINYQFAAGIYEVTFAEYDRFAKATGWWFWNKKPDDEGWGRGNRPVINVSWNDAVAYTKWLSKQTAKEYRLPSEAEWEYVARAGTTTKYWWGNSIENNKANCDGCGSRWDNKETAPVGSFSANKFGLYDTVGNVWEWCADKYHDNYKNAPTDGSVWDYATSNKLRVWRGGSWFNNPNYTRSAFRNWHYPDGRNNFLGFRVFLVF